MLVNWWAYTWGGLYSEVYGIQLLVLLINMLASRLVHIFLKVVNFLITYLLDRTVMTQIL